MLFSTVSSTERRVLLSTLGHFFYGVLPKVSLEQFFELLGLYRVVKNFGADFQSPISIKHHKTIAALKASLAKEWDAIPQEMIQMQLTTFQKDSENVLMQIAVNLLSEINV